MKKPVSRTIATAVSAVLLCGALAGCSSDPLANANTANNEAQSGGGTYMSQVNQAVEELDTRLDDFIDAVARGDAVSMKTQADRALKEVDTLTSLEAPDEIKDVKAKYDEGCTAIKEALTAYVNLYTSGNPVTQEALADIQARYDAGVAALTEADKLASEKK